jgi:hypothetical protein
MAEQNFPPLNQDIVISVLLDIITHDTGEAERVGLASRATMALQRRFIVQGGVLVRVVRHDNPFGSQLMSKARKGVLVMDGKRCSALLGIVTCRARIHCTAY